MRYIYKLNAVTVVPESSATTLVSSARCVATVNRSRFTVRGLEQEDTGEDYYAPTHESTGESHADLGRQWRIVQTPFCAVNMTKMCAHAAGTSEKLNKALPGQRGGPIALRKRIEGILEDISFRQSRMNPCLWMNMGGLMLFPLGRMGDFLFIGHLENAQSVMHALHNSAALNMVGFLLKPVDELKFLGSFIRRVRDRYTIRTDLESVKAGVAALSLEGCNPSELAGILLSNVG